MSLLPNLAVEAHPDGVHTIVRLGTCGGLTEHVDSASVVVALQDSARTGPTGGA